MSPPATIEEALSNAVRALTAVSESPRLDAEALLAWVLRAPRTYLFTHPEERLRDQAASEFSAAIVRREKGEPIAYITGSKEFWSMQLNTSPAILVPRPETETLVEQALTLIPRDEPCRVLDLGTGSGAIALAISRERAQSMIVATDSSREALKIAEQNARQHKANNITFLHGDWLTPVAGQTFDIIVSNPPYVSDDDPAFENLMYEPRSALAAGSDGLDALRKIAREAIAVAETNGYILLEHGAEQQDAVAAILTDYDWTDIACIKDLAGHPRVTTARMRTSTTQD